MELRDSPLLNASALDHMFLNIVRPALFSSSVLEILDGIKRTRRLTYLKTERAKDTVSKGWGKFPGIVPVLWKALGGTSAAVRKRPGPSHQFHQFQKAEKIVKRSEI